MKNQKSSIINRRQFLCGTSLGVAVFHISPGRVMGAERVSPNERLNVAGIGATPPGMASPWAETADPVAGPTMEPGCASRSADAVSGGFHCNFVPRWAAGSFPAVLAGSSAPDLIFVVGLWFRMRSLGMGIS